MKSARIVDEAKFVESVWKKKLIADCPGEKWTFAIVPGFLGERKGSVEWVASDVHNVGSRERKHVN